jgi:hypothetical protein
MKDGRNPELSAKCNPQRAIVTHFDYLQALS